MSVAVLQAHHSRGAVSIPFRRCLPKTLGAHVAPFRDVDYSHERSVYRYSSPESLGGASFRLCCLFFPILRRRVGFERTEKTTRDAGYLIDGSQKRGLVRLRWLVKPADFSHELKRSRSNLFVGDWRIEIEKS